MTAVRLLRVPLPVACSPETALRALAGDAWPFALTGRWAGGGALVGSEPLRVAGPDEDPFALLDEQPAVEAGDHGDAVGGGWFGWLGYGLGARIEELPPQPPRPVPLPPFQLAWYDHLLRQDAADGWWFEALATPEREHALERRLAELRTRLEAAAAAEQAADGAHPTAALADTAHPTAAPADAARATANGADGAARSAPALAPPRDPFRIAAPGGAGHLLAVEDCRERIAAGEIFQANVCLRLETAWEGDVAELFAHASARLRPAYGAAFPAPWGGVASLSPELFLRRRGRAVETAPIKGTVARPAAAAPADAAAADADVARAALVGSAKDHAEHVMIVDLMRNDLGRVCAYGSIEAARTPEAEPHPGVWHLVSRVRGTLRPEVGDGALLRASFPPGSVTGAPKVQAMRTIAALESTGRELYTGAIGYASPLAGLELNVAIRTFEARAGRLWLGAGGGIVADSEPARELEECLVKARPLVAAIGGRIAEDAPSAAAPPSHALAPPALGPLGRRRPDPGRGVFETLLVRDGVALHAREHLERLGRSVAALYGRALPHDLPERVATLAEGAALHRLRVVVAPAPDGTLDPRLQRAPHVPRVPPVALAPFTLPGGLGAHKWLDRELLDALAAQQHGATPLLLDGDGSVLEAAWANVFAVEGETLLTPPADGRILPGVTRALLLEAAGDAGLAAAEAELTLPRLAAADAILLSSAAAGALPAVLAGTDAGASRSERAAALAARLLRAVEARSVPATSA